MTTREGAVPLSYMLFRVEAVSLQSTVLEVGHGGNPTQDRQYQIPEDCIDLMVFFGEQAGSLPCNERGTFYFLWHLS